MNNSFVIFEESIVSVSIPTLKLLNLKKGQNIAETQLYDIMSREIIYVELLINADNTSPN